MRAYYKPDRSNWIVGLPWWLVIPAGILYLTAALVAGALMLALFLLVEAGKGGAWLWRHR